MAVTIELLNAIGSLATAAAVVVAVAFGIVQARATSAKRRHEATLEFVRGAMSSELHRAAIIVLNFPDNTRLEDVRAKGPEAMHAVLVLGSTMETLGILVANKTIDIRTAKDLYDVPFIWSRLRGYIEDSRAQRGHKQLFAWFEWLASEMERLPVRLPPRATAA